jgi:hypothetical protein
MSQPGGKPLLEVIGCKILSALLTESDRKKTVKVYVTVIQSGAAQLTYPTAGKKLFEIDPSFTFTWAFWNEKIGNIPKECKLVLELRMLDHDTDKEIKVASCVLASAALSEDAAYFDLTEMEKGRRVDGVAAAVGLRVIPAARQQQMRQMPERWRSIGRLRAVVWRGRKLSSTYPVYLSIGLGVAGTAKNKSAVVSVPRDPIFDHIVDMDLFSMQGDVVIALWEVHNVRSHKQLGQMIFPLSWLANMSTQSKSGTSASISGWFQFLPMNKATAYNNGGQYRPYIPGTPQFTGFGLDEPGKDKTAGYLLVQLSIDLNKPLFRSMFFQPSLYAHGTPEVEQIDDDSVMAIVASMIMARNNLMQIYQLMRYPMWLLTFSDIVRWREHPAFTFWTIYFWTYSILVAPTWQYPMLACLFFIFIGFATSRRRNFSGSHLYIPEMDVDTSEESTLREKYNKLKSAAYSVASLVETMRVTIERGGNIFTWADPMLTAATILLMLAFCSSFSLVLLIFPPHVFIFCAGMMAFVPEDFMDYAMAVMKEYKKKVKKYIKHRNKSAAQAKTDDGASTTATTTTTTTSTPAIITTGAEAFPTRILRSVSGASSPGSPVGSPRPQSTGHLPAPAPAPGVGDLSALSPLPAKSNSRGNIFMQASTTAPRRNPTFGGNVGLAEFGGAGKGGSSHGSASLLAPDLAPAGHVRSTFMLSQYWERGLSGHSHGHGSGSSDSLNDGAGAETTAPALTSPSASKQWSSRWCELWKAPPVLSVTSGGEGKKTFISMEGAVAHYM